MENAGKTFIDRSSNTKPLCNKTELNRKSEIETHWNKQEVSIISRTAGNPVTKNGKKLASIMVVWGRKTPIIIIIIIINTMSLL